MSTTVTQKVAGILHLGKMRARVRTELQSEGEILYLAEGVAETVILRSFKAPGIRCLHRRMGFIGFFVLTECRFVASAKFYNTIDVNAAFDEQRFKQFAFKATPKYLSITFDPSIQSPEMSGEVEIRMHLADVAAAARILREKGASIELDRIAL